MLTRLVKCIDAGAPDPILAPNDQVDECVLWYARPGLWSVDTYPAKKLRSPNSPRIGVPEEDNYPAVALWDRRRKSVCGS